MAPIDPKLHALVPGVMRAAEVAALGLDGWVQMAPMRAAERAAKRELRESRKELADVTRRHPQIHELWGEYPIDVATGPRGRLADLLRPACFSAPGREVAVGVITTGDEARVFRLALGEADHVRLDVRKLVTLVRLQRGDSLTLCHNHERSPQPSDLDLDLAQAIHEECEPHNIAMIDFMIVSPRWAWSLTKRRIYRRST